MNTPASALLISGSEERHRVGTCELERYLTSIGRTSKHLTLPSPRQAYNELETLLKLSPSNRPILISFYGHGSDTGWESGGWGNISYKKIVGICSDFPHYIQFVNSTCYGHFLVKELIGRRSIKTTGVISDWEADAESYGTAMQDILKSWPEGLRPEERLTEDIHSSEEGGFDLHFMSTFRWGAMFDKWFFPPKSLQAVK